MVYAFSLNRLSVRSSKQTMTDRCIGAAKRTRISAKMQLVVVSVTAVGCTVNGLTTL